MSDTQNTTSTEPQLSPAATEAKAEWHKAQTALEALESHTLEAYSDRRLSVAQQVAAGKAHHEKVVAQRTEVEARMNAYLLQLTADNQAVVDAKRKAETDAFNQRQETRQTEHASAEKARIKAGYLESFLKAGGTKEAFEHDFEATIWPEYLRRTSQAQMGQAQRQQFARMHAKF